MSVTAPLMIAVRDRILTINGTAPYTFDLTEKVHGDLFVPGEKPNVRPPYVCIVVPQIVVGALGQKGTQRQTEIHLYAYVARDHGDDLGWELRAKAGRLQDEIEHALGVDIRLRGTCQNLVIDEIVPNVGIEKALAFGETLFVLKALNVYQGSNLVS